MAKIKKSYKDELIIARKEACHFIQEEKEKAWQAELIIARKELAFQNRRERKTGNRAG